MLEEGLVSFTAPPLPSLAAACKPAFTSLSYLPLRVKIIPDDINVRERTI
jgi:hypothetical protein